MSVDFLFGCGDKSLKGINHAVKIFKFLGGEFFLFDVNSVLKGSNLIQESVFFGFSNIDVSSKSFNLDFEFIDSCSKSISLVSESSDLGFGCGPLPLPAAAEFCAQQH